MAINAAPTIDTSQSPALSPKQHRQVMRQVDKIRANMRTAAGFSQAAFQVMARGTSRRKRIRKAK